jgi:hypothetical protein
MKIIDSFEKWLARKRKKPLSAVIRRSLYISIVIHGLLLVGAGVFVISHIFYNKESTFVGQPPPMKTYEPRKLEFKVKVSKQQRSSSRPSMSPRMVSTKMSDIALPEIKVDPKIVKTSFQPKFKAVSGAGLGAGLGTGYGIGGFGTGVSSFDFFGIKGRGDKICILVDVSVSMVEDEKGGERGFQRVKDRIGKVIDALSAGAIFNVIAFADAASTFEKEMVVANEDNKTKAKQFVRPFNTGGSYGLTSGNIESSSIGVPAAGGTTRLDLALTGAFEQGADTILIISDGLPMVRKGITMAQRQAHSAMIANWQKQNEGAMQQYEAAAASYTPEVTSVKVWIPDQPAIPARPPGPAPKITSLKEGQAIPQADPGSPGRAAIPGHWEVRTQVANAAPARPQPPPMADPGWWTFADFVQHFRILNESLYAKKGKKAPIVHAIGYSIDKEGGAFLKALTDTYHGRYRRVTKID